MSKFLVPTLSIIATLALVAVAGVAFYAQRQPPEPVRAANRLDPEAFTLPDFELMERSGKVVRREDLLGKVWVAGFIFTRCPSTCPLVTGVMARLRTELPQQVQMVSFSVDPEYDTPEVLTAYAKDFDAQSWWFVTGDRSALYSLIRDGFKLGVQENPDFGKQPGEMILHSTRLAVVDREGNIRGYFDASDQAQVDLLQRRVKELVE